MTNRQVLMTAILIMAISMSIAGTQDVFGNGEEPENNTIWCSAFGDIQRGGVFSTEGVCEIFVDELEINDEFEVEIDGELTILGSGRCRDATTELTIYIDDNGREGTITIEAEGESCRNRNPPPPSQDGEFEFTITGGTGDFSFIVGGSGEQTTELTAPRNFAIEIHGTLEVDLEQEEPEVVEVHCEVEYHFEMLFVFGERHGYGECVYIFSDGSEEEHEVDVSGSFQVGSLIDGFRTIDGEFHIEDYENSLWLDETGSIEIDCDIETSEEEEFETPYCLETDVTVAGGEGIFSFLEGEGTREATGYFSTEFIFTEGYAYSTIWIFFGDHEEPECETECEEPEPEPETEEQGGGGDDRHKTSPTSGNDWNTLENLVEGGITVDRVSFTLTDNWYTPFEQIQIETGSTHSFGVKTFAQNGGIMVQEIAFGIPEVGFYQDAEALVEVHYDWDKTILELVVVQDTEVLNVLSVSTDQVLCRSDSTAICYQTNLTIKFNEPLKDQVYAVKAFDMTRRTMMPHYFNDGINVFGDSLNPMLTKQIASTERYEGLITITQIEKYSNLWVTEDGRIFDSDNYFKQTNKVYQYGYNDARGSVIQQQIADGQAYLASQLYFDSSKIQGTDGGFIAPAVDLDGIDHREQTLQKLVSYNGN